MSDTELIHIGEGILLIPNDRGYRFRIITTPEGWRVLLRDDGYRIHSIYISEKPLTVPLGAREWECLWEYKHSDAPGHQLIVEMIMGQDKEPAGNEHLRNA